LLIALSSLGPRRAKSSKLIIRLGVSRTNTNHNRNQRSNTRAFRSYLPFCANYISTTTCLKRPAIASPRPVCSNDPNRPRARSRPSAFILTLTLKRSTQHDTPRAHAPSRAPAHETGHKEPVDPVTQCEALVSEYETFPSLPILRD